MTEISLVEKFQHLIDMLCDLSETYWEMGELHKALAVIDGHDSLLESEDAAPVDKARLQLQQTRMMLQQAIADHTLNRQSGALSRRLDEITALSGDGLTGQIQQVRGELDAALRHL